MESEMDKARENIQRAERIAKTTNKSSFMNLGENGPKLLSESGTNYSQSKGGDKQSYKSSNMDESYLNDDTVPAEIFSLIHAYREIIS